MTVAVLALAEQRAALLDTADAVGVGAAFVDRRGRAVAANPAFRTLCANREARSRLAELVRARFAVPGAGAEATALVPLPPAHVAALRVLPGEEMALVQVRAQAPARARADLDELGLTPAQQRVARWLAEGLPNRTIAERLGVTEHTARRHTEQIFAKLGVRSRAAAALRLTGG